MCLKNGTRSVSVSLMWSIVLLTECLMMEKAHVHLLPHFVETCKLMKKTALIKKYNQTENPDNPEPPVNTGALVYCHRDWMLTIRRKIVKSLVNWEIIRIFDAELLKKGQI